MVIPVPSARSLRATRENLAATGLEGPAARVVRGDLVAFAAAPAALDRDGPDRFDLVVADPPYAWDGWPDLLAALVGRTPVLVAESDREVGPATSWDVARVRTHGTTVVTVFVADQPLQPGPPCGAPA